MEGLDGARIEGVRAETLVIENCRNTYVGKCDVRRIEVRGGSNIKVEGMVMDRPLNADTVFIEVWNSPGFVASWNKLDGAGIFVWGSKGVKILNNEIDISNHNVEGVQLRGPGEFLVAENEIRGDYARSNDLMQISNESGNGPSHQPFFWPEREKLNFSKPAVRHSGWVYHEATFLTPENKGKTITYGYDPSVYADNVIVRNNRLIGSKVAGLFLWRVKNGIVDGNYVQDTHDYGLGGEWVKDIVFKGNKVVQSPQFIGRGGGIAVMNAADDVSVTGNELDGSTILVRPWGFPIYNVLIKNNVVRNGGRISAMYGGTMWLKGLQIEDNVIYGGFIDVNSSPFYTTGVIQRNTVHRSGNDLRFGISVESFDGVVSANKVFGAEFPYRDFNAEGRLTSKVVFSGNLQDGKSAKMQVYVPEKKPPLSLAP